MPVDQILRKYQRLIQIKVFWAASQEDAAVPDFQQILSMQQAPLSIHLTCIAFLHGREGMSWTEERV